LRRRLEGLGFDGVRFFGRVSEERKRDLLCRAWVLVHPGVREGWGLNVLEAAACGTPAVAYRVAGLCDSVRDGVTGFLARNGDVRDLANKIIRVLEDEALRERLSRNCLEYARQFSWNKTTTQFIKILDWAINEA